MSKMGFTVHNIDRRRDGINFVELHTYLKNYHYIIRQGLFKVCPMHVIHISMVVNNCWKWYRNT